MLKNTENRDLSKTAESIEICTWTLYEKTNKINDLMKLIKRKKLPVIKKIAKTFIHKLTKYFKLINLFNKLNNFFLNC